MVDEKNRYPTLFSDSVKPSTSFIDLTCDSAFSACNDESINISATFVSLDDSIVQYESQKHPISEINFSFDDIKDATLDDAEVDYRSSKNSEPLKSSEKDIENNQNDQKDLNVSDKTIEDSSTVEVIWSSRQQKLPSPLDTQPLPRKKLRIFKRRGEVSTRPRSTFKLQSIPKQPKISSSRKRKADTPLEHEETCSRIMV